MWLIPVWMNGVVCKDDEGVVKSLRTSFDLLSRGSFDVQFVVAWAGEG